MKTGRPKKKILNGVRVIETDKLSNDIIIKIVECYKLKISESQIKRLFNVKDWDLRKIKKHNNNYKQLVKNGAISERSNLDFELLEELFGFGLSIKQVCAGLRISETMFNKWKTKDARIEEAVRNSQMRLNAGLIRNLMVLCNPRLRKKERIEEIDLIENGRFVLDDFGSRQKIYKKVIETEEMPPSEGALIFALKVNMPGVYGESLLLEDQNKQDPELVEMSSNELEAEFHKLSNEIKLLSN